MYQHVTYMLKCPSVEKAVPLSDFNCCVLVLITVIFPLVCMGMTSLSAVVSVFTLRMHYGMFMNAPPGWLNRVTASTFGHISPDVKNKTDGHSLSAEENVSLGSISTSNSPKTSTHNMQNVTSAIPEESLRGTIDRLLSEVEKLKKQVVDSREQQDHVTVAWRSSARGFDMLCFWIFVIFLVALAIVVVCISLLHLGF